MDLSEHMSKAEVALKSLTLKPSTKRRRTLGKKSARQTPTAKHKQMFLDALEVARWGAMPSDLLHFYKYLQVNVIYIYIFFGIVKKNRKQSVFY